MTTRKKKVPTTHELWFAPNEKDRVYSNNILTLSRYEESADNVVSVFALRTNSWKKIENSPYDHSGRQRKSGVLVSGELHWFAGTSTSEVIVVLDLADEKFHIVPSLDSMGDKLAVLGGCLCVYGKSYNDDRADFWVMKEYGVGDSWTKFIVTYDKFHLSYWKPLSSSRTDRVLFQGNCSKLFRKWPWPHSHDSRS